MSDRTHKEFMTKHKLTMLKTAAQHVIDNHNPVIDIGIFRDTIRDYNNWQKLRYHGLIWHYTGAGVTKRGKWIITTNGWRFLRGQLQLSKYVLIRGNHIVEHSPDTIGVKDVYRGAEEITTIFEYYDDNGNYVGARPVNPIGNRQTRLMI
jgi:hypothetical protein